MNAKKTKALRRFANWRFAEYNQPDPIPVFYLVPDGNGKPIPQFSHFKTATITLIHQCGKALYRRMKTSFRKGASAK